MYSVHCYRKLVLFLTVHSPQVPGHLHEGRGGTQDQPPRVQSPGIELGSSLQPQDQPPRVQSPGMELYSSLQSHDQPPRVHCPGMELGSSIQPQDQPPRVKSPGIELGSIVYRLKINLPESRVQVWS